MAELTLAPETPRADPRPLRERFERSVARRNETVARVAALERGADHESRRQHGGHVLHRVHGNVRPSVAQGVLQLLDEEALAAGGSKTAVRDPVALGHERNESDDEP